MNSSAERLRLAEINVNRKSCVVHFALADIPSQKAFKKDTVLLLSPDSEIKHDPILNTGHLDYDGSTFDQWCF